MGIIPALPAKRGLAEWSGKIVLGLAILVLDLLVGILVAGAKVKARLKANHPPAGQLIDIGGYRLHLDCRGTGNPTVILEAGMGEFGLTWALVQPELAKTNRVCVYDRAGYGWSEPSPRPRNAEVMAEELHRLLVNARVEGPYVLVGHSFGGIVCRRFACQYPAEVVGMVLVDSAHEEQAIRLPESMHKAWPPLSGLIRFGGLLSRLGIIALHPAVIPMSSRMPAHLAAETREAIAFNPGYFDMIEAEGDYLIRGGLKPVTTLGDIPLIVLTRGHLDPEFLRAGYSSEAVQRYELDWQAMQIDLATLSPQGKLEVVEQSGHNIQIEAPERVISAVRAVIAAVHG